MNDDESVSSSFHVKAGLLLCVPTLYRDYQQQTTPPLLVVVVEKGSPPRSAMGKVWLRPVIHVLHQNLNCKLKNLGKARH